MRLSFEIVVQLRTRTRLALVVCMALAGIGVVLTLAPPRFATPAHVPLAGAANAAGSGVHYQFGETLSLALAGTLSRPVDVVTLSGGRTVVADVDNGVLLLRPDGSVADRLLGSDAVSFPCDERYVFPRSLIAVESAPARETLYIAWHCHERAWSIERRGLTGERFGPGTVAFSGSTGSKVVSFTVEPISGDLISYDGPDIERFSIDKGSIWLIPGEGRGTVLQAEVISATEFVVRRAESTALEVYGLNGVLARQIELGATPRALHRQKALLVVIVDGQGQRPEIRVMDARGQVLEARPLEDWGVSSSIGWPMHLAWNDSALTLLWGDLRARLRRFAADRSVIWSLDAARVTVGTGPPVLRADLGVLAARGDCLASALVANREGYLLEDGRRLLSFAGPVGLVDIEVNDRCRVAALDMEHQIWTYSGIEASLAGSAFPEAPQAMVDARLAAFADGWLVALPSSSSVERIGPTGRTTWRRSELPFWPTDLATTADNIVFTLDRQRGRVERWQGSELAHAWPVGLASPATMLAVGADDSSIPIVAVLTEENRIEVYRHDGILVDDVDALASGLSVVDAIGASEHGQIYVRGGAGESIAVFQDQGSSAAPSPTPTPQTRPDSCRMQGAARTDPDTIVLGQTSTMRLTLSVDCPEQRQAIGTDIVLAIDVNSDLERAQILAKAILAGVALDRDRVAVVSFGLVARVAARRSVEDAFSADLRRITADIESLSDGSNSFSRMLPPLSLASSLFNEAGRGDAVSTLLLITNGSEVPNPGHPEYPPMKEEAIRFARELRERGVQLFCIGMERLRNPRDRDYLVQIAGSPSRFWSSDQLSATRAINRTIGRDVRYAVSGRTLASHSFNERVTYVSGSAGGRAIEAERRLLWSQDLMPAAGLTLTYAVRPEVSGSFPVGETIEAQFLGKDGPLAQITVAVPGIRVVTPSPTPTDTPSPTATPRPLVRVYLPITLHQYCVEIMSGTDYIFVIDASHSMQERLDGGPSRLTAVKNALRRSIEAGMISAPDQVAIIGFNDTARLYHPLGPPGQDTATVIDAIVMGANSRLSTGLDASITEFVSRRRNPNNQAVLVMLTDGKIDDPVAAAERAAIAKAMRVLSFAVLIGATDHAEASLEGLTSGAGYLLRAATSEAVELDVAAITHVRPCLPSPSWP